LGVFWKRATGRAAFLALWLGAVLGIGIFFLDMFKVSSGWDQVIAWHKLWTGYELTSMFASFYLCVFCGLIVVVASRLSPEPLKEEAKPLVWEDWREPLRGEAHGHGLGNYRILSAVVCVTFVVLYLVFS
jgi:SSS family solute:Na+ symporter